MISSIRYLGGKRRTAERLTHYISHGATIGEAVVDLFAGAHAVSRTLAPRFRVIANDVQHYSETLGRGLLLNPAHTVTSGALRELICPLYQRNMEALLQLFGDGIVTEARLGDPEAPHWSFGAYADMCANYPHSTAIGQTLSNSRNVGSSDENGHSVYQLCSTRFAMAYFGAVQSAAIDSLRYAADHVDPTLQPLVMTALLFTASNIVSSPGHFAQYLKPHSDKIARRIAKTRKADVLSIFFNKVDELFSTPRKYRAINVVTRQDALTLLEELREGHFGSISAVYADPPYTDDQYSRFYHVLETLVLNDYPEARGVGRYRQHLYQSAFSLSSQAEEAILGVIERTATLNANLFLSYNSSGIVDIDIIKRMASQHYRRVEAKEIETRYSRQGRVSADGSSPPLPVTEYLVVAGL